MNLVEKILAAKSGRAKVEPGDVVVAEIDRLIMHDLSAFLTSKVFEEQVGLPVKNPERVILVFDHNFCPATESQAIALKHNREWARRHGFNLFDCGSGNIHNVVMRQGFVQPGMIVVGSDSHTPVHGSVGALGVALGNDSHAGTVLPFSQAWFKVPETVRVELTGVTPPGTTARDVALWLVAQLGEGGLIYDAVEFAGDYLTGLSFWSRWLFPLLCVDLGAKCSFVEPDEVTERFVRSLPGGGTAELMRSDGGEAARHVVFDVSQIGPQVACPPTVGDVRPVEDLIGTPLQWTELGGHGGGRFEDIQAAAALMEGHRVHPNVLFNIVPASRDVFEQALRTGLVAKLHEAGATWFPPSTGSNQAINMGAMAAGEAMLSTHARNFPGRNGSPDAAHYLASSSTVAASAIAGSIADPRSVLALAGERGRR